MPETWVQSLDWEDPPGEGKGYPLQYSVLESSMEGVVYGVLKSQTELNNFHPLLMKVQISQLVIQDPS